MSRRDKETYSDSNSSISNRPLIMIATMACLAFGLAVIAWLWLFPPFPDEQDVVGLYAAHKQEFATLAKMAESHCVWQLAPEVQATANRIKSGMEVFCDHGTVRFILGERAYMAIGPERIMGLTYIPGDPAREGTVVPVIGVRAQEVGYVYLRQVDSHWYVFTQNTD